MNATIKTLEVIVGDKNVPLTKAMAHQFEWHDPSNWTMPDLESGRVKVLGEVSLTDGIFILLETPHGIQRMRAGNLSQKVHDWLKAKGLRVERLILIK